MTERYPTALGVFCDRCRHEWTGDFIVHTGMTYNERLDVVRAHVRALGWLCDSTGDFCPDCKVRRAQKVKAPWPPAIVADLNRHQRSLHFHPYTCPDAGHTLLATANGWVCPEGCDYTQDWAHPSALIETSEDQV